MSMIIIEDGVPREMTADELAALPKIEDMPKPPQVLTPLQFLERLTVDERVAIRAAAKQNPLLDDWLDMLRATSIVDLADPRTVGGVRAIVSAGLLTTQRGDELLAPVVS